MPERAIPRRHRLVFIGTIAGLASLAAVGCGKAPPGAVGHLASPTGSAGPAVSLPASTPATASGRIGADCGMIPLRGPGGFTSMRTQPAVAAVASNPQFSVFVSSISAAHLTGTFNSSRALTLFVPENSAFAALSSADIAMLRQPGEVAKVVKHHVVAAKITPSQIAAGGRITTLEGSSLELSKSGADYLVGGATVLCGNIMTANATIYLISKVLLPP